MSSELGDRIAAKSNDELLQMLHKDAAQYRPEVLQMATQEAMNRGLSLEAPPDPPPPPQTAGEVTPSGFVYYAAGRLVICGHCGGKRFVPRQILLNTRALAFFDLDWLNASAFALTCLSCQRIEWFARVEQYAEELPEAP